MQRPLLETCADRVPRPPYGACANTAEPTEAHSQGAKDHRAAPNLYGDPDNCEPADTIPGLTGSRRARRSPGCSSCGRRQAATLKPGPATPRQA